MTDAEELTPAVMSKVFPRGTVRFDEAADS